MGLKRLEIEFPIDSEETEPQSKRLWFYSFLLALLIHLFFFFYKLDWGHVSMMPRVEIQQVDPAKLEAIRKSWREKSLLLGKNQAKEEKAPEDARYFSDRNVHVEKEQRARITNVIPKTGRAGPEVDEHTVKTPEGHAGEPKALSQPALGNLGIPMKFTSRKPEEEDPGEKQPLPNQAGGDQAVLDRELPIGSENMLNAQESVFYSFYSRLYEAIGPLWQSKIRSVPYHRKLPPGDYVTVVDVVFDSGGNLIGVHRLQSSGIEEFDTAADQCWKKIGRFPNPPQALLDQNNEVHTGWTFSVRIEDGFNMNFLPPERNY